MLNWLVALSLVAAADAIVLEGPASVEFTDAAAPRIARLAVKPTTVKVRDDDVPQVAEFASGDLRLDAPSGALTASWQLLKDGTPAALVLTLAESVRRPGAYRAVLVPLPASQPAERLVVQITIRAAKLKLPDKVVVSVTARWPLESDIVAPPIIAHEQTGLTRVQALSATRLSANVGALPASAGLTPWSAPVAIAPGGQADIPYSPVGHFPLGLVTGKLWLTAAELADGVELDYEVRTRLSSGFIFVVIGAGFFLGYFVRVYLANVIAVSGALEQASTLMTQVDASMADRPDQTFRDAFAAEKQQLATAMAGNTAAAIAGAVTALDGKWRAAVAEFAQREHTAALALDELRELSGPPATLPPAVAPALASAGAAVVTARAALDRRDVTTAEQAIDGARPILVSAVRQAAIAWQDAIAVLLTGLESAAFGLPLSVTTDFAARRKSARPLDQISEKTPVATPDDRRALFLTWHEEYRDAHGLLQELDARLGTEWGLVAREAAPVKARVAPAMDALAVGYAALRASLTAAADDPAPLAASLSDRLKTLDDAWRAAFVDVAPADKRPPLVDLWKAREYVKLARQLASAWGDTLLGGGAAPPIPVGAWIQAPAGAPIAAARANIAPFTFAAPTAVVPRLSAGSARAWQSILLAATYMVVYWMVAHDTFGEKWSEPATLLVTSFMVDVSADGLIGALTKLRG